MEQAGSCAVDEEQTPTHTHYKIHKDQKQHTGEPQTEPQRRHTNDMVDCVLKQDQER